jgi:hypothetical protein
MINHGQHPLHDITGKPIISMESRLLADVQRCEARLDAARLDLRNWRLSHDEQGKTGG